jgi:hypothetical protein
VYLVLLHKSGVNLGSGSRQVWFAIGAAQAVLSAKGLDCVITSLNDGTHGAASLHYSDNAVDLRTKHIPQKLKQVVVAQLTECLNPLGFDLVHESAGLPNEHLHIEFQPKVGESFLREVAA